MGRRVIVRLGNQCRLARSPPLLPSPGLAPRPSGLCMHKQASPSSSLLTSGSKSANGERQKGEEVSSERYLSLGDLLGGEGQPRGRFACQFRQQSFLPLPSLSITGRGTPKGLPFAVLFNIKRLFLSWRWSALQKKRGFSLFPFRRGFFTPWKSYLISWHLKSEKRGTGKKDPQWRFR